MSDNLALVLLIALAVFAYFIAPILAYLAEERTSRKKFSYSVWVGGGEVNEDYISDIYDAIGVARTWRDCKGYDDVYIEIVNSNHERIGFISGF